MYPMLTIIIAAAITVAIELWFDKRRKDTMPRPGHPPEPDDYGAMQDNCGNWVAYIRPDFLDDIITELDPANGDPSLGIAMLRAIRALVPPKENRGGPGQQTSESR